MKVIFRGEWFEAVNIQNLLEDQGVRVFVDDELSAYLQPWAITAGGFNPLVLRVNDDDVEKAIQIIKSRRSDGS